MAKPRSIEEMLSMAAGASEDSGEGDVAALLAGDPAPKAVKKPVAEPPEPVRIEEEPVQVQPTKVVPVSQKPQERVETEKVIPERPAYSSNRKPWELKDEKPSQSVFKPMNRVSTVSVAVIERVIDAFMFYEGLTSAEKEVIKGFLRLEPSRDVPEVVFGAIQMDSVKVNNLDNLVSLYTMDGVSRAWALIELENDTLLGISENAALFSPGYVPVSDIGSQQEKIAFARDLEQAIANIDGETMRNLFPVKEFLVKARGEL